MSITRASRNIQIHHSSHHNYSQTRVKSHVNLKLINWLKENTGKKVIPVRARPKVKKRKNETFLFLRHHHKWKLNNIILVNFPHECFGWRWRGRCAGAGHRARKCLDGIGVGWKIKQCDVWLMVSYWSTVQRDAKKFEIERREKETRWETLGQVNAAWRKALSIFPHSTRIIFPNRQPSVRTHRHTRE